jgi:hypothetical protein
MDLTCRLVRRDEDIVVLCDQPLGSRWHPARAELFDLLWITGVEALEIGRYQIVVTRAAHVVETPALLLMLRARLLSEAGREIFALLAYNLVDVVVG